MERDGHPVALRGGHQRTLIALLLMADGVPISRDRLIEELWGSLSPRARSRRCTFIFPSYGICLVTSSCGTPPGYSLRAGSFELDCRQFDALVSAARSEPARAQVLLREALRLIRGEPLCDVACEGHRAMAPHARREALAGAVTTD